MPSARARLALGLTLALSLALASSGCARAAQPPAASPSSAEATSAPSSATRSTNSVDIAEAQETVLAYIDALRSRDASEAASLMTSYRRGETRAKGWKADVGWWRSARLKAVMHPGRYLSDERAFTQLYAEHFGHPPYKMVVLNVSYALGPGVPLGDTDFAVTQDSAKSPWLVHEFGGALLPPQPSSLPSSTP